MRTASIIFKLRYITAISAFGLLTACSGSNQPAPISTIGNYNEQNTSAGNKPKSEPVTSAVPQVQALPSQQSLIKQTAAQQSVPPPVQAPASAIQNTTDATTSTPVADNVQIRNGHIVYNRQYNSIAKGSYTGGSNYTVKHGDTLFYIAWITGNDYRDLAKRNHIQSPYSLTPGQILQVETASGGSLTDENALSRADSSAHQPSTVQQQTAEKTVPQVAAQSAIAYSANQGKPSNQKTLPDNQKTTSVPASNTPVPSPAAGNTTPGMANLNWHWPTKGKITGNFSPDGGGNKGIDIAGKKGQPVLAAAGGRVVYAGNALRGYGNLIIIKHNDDFLSAYAHNDTMLVREQQEVKAGQKIATMGETGTTSTHLHFEVRYKGKPVNPLRYLPQKK